MSATSVHYGHTEPVPVHFDDLDPMGVVHNARYAVLLERALSAYWSPRGHSFDGGRPSTSDVVHAVRQFSIEYLAPIRGTGQIRVHFWIQRLGTSSGVYGFRMLSADGQLVHARGTRAVVKIDPATGQPSPWSESAREIASALAVPAAPLAGSALAGEEVAQ